MTLAVIHLLAEAGTTIADSWVELAGTAMLVAFLGGAWRKIECHQGGCHRIGRFEHGHYKLCHVHHPNVPSDGLVTASHIATQTHDGKEVA